MNINQKDQIEYYIKKLEEVLSLFQETKDPSELYDICDQIQAIYSKEIYEISDVFDNVCNYSGLIERSSKTMLALLKNYLSENYNPLENELVNNTRQCLKKFPDVLTQYNSALSKYEQANFERNTLDDMRLSFELLLKRLLSNEKSLENQISILGDRLKTITSVELRNMLTTIIRYYTNYQNEHVKHNDKINENEIEFIIELTSVIMKFLVKTLI